MLPEQLELEFDYEIRLTFQCSDSVPDASTATVELLPENHSLKHGKPRGYLSKGPSPTEGLFKVFQAAIAEDAAQSSATALVRRAGQLWSAAQRLRGELRLVNLRYPIKYSMAPESDVLAANVIVLLPEMRCKAEVTFMATATILREWPRSVASIEVSAKTIYGTAE